LRRVWKNIIKWNLRVSINPLERLSIRQKVVFVSLILSVTLGLFGVYFFTRLSVIDQSTGELDQRYSRLKNVLALEVDSQKLSNIVRSYVLTQDPQDQIAYNQASIDLDNTLQTLSTDHLGPSESKAVSDYQVTTELLKGTELLILAEVKEGSVNQARSLFNLNYEIQQDRATSLITNLVTTESATVSTLFSQNQQQVDSIQRSLVLTLSVIIIVAVVYIYLFSQDIVQSIQALTNVASRFAKGDFTARVNVTLHSDDEIGQLGNVFNNMAKELSQNMRQVAQRTDQLSEEKARFLSSINTLPLGFIMTDASNAVLNLNPAMQNMLGFKEAEFSVDQISEQFKNTDGFLEQLLAHSQESLKIQKSINIHEMSDKGRLFRAFFSPVVLADSQSQQAIGTVILVEDVTEERVMARSKDEFFSIASHELRTPLTAIRGNTSMIQQFYKDQLKDQKLNQMVGDIHESSIRLIEIVNDFLDASRLEQGKMQFKLEEFALENVIENVVYEMAGVANEKKIALRMINDLDTLPHVLADKNKIKQVIYNLVGNALKFVESGSITIDAKVTGNFLKVYVIDTGRGISVTNQQFLFHKFQQASSSIITRDTTRGTGLGLYISRLLIGKMGGEIALEHSEEGKGSTFSFTVPLFTAVEPDSQPNK
jgi:PAS domain S-box-containing protein